MGVRHGGYAKKEMDIGRWHITRRDIHRPYHTFSSQYRISAGKNYELFNGCISLATKTAYIHLEYFCIIYGVSYYNLNLAENLNTQLFMG